MKALGLLLSLSIFISLSSCSEPESKTKNSIPSVSTQAVQEIEKIQNEVSQGYVLKKAASDEKGLIENQLTRAKTAILRLQNDPTDKGALRVLNDARKALQEFKPAEKDRSRFEVLEQRLGQVAMFYAGKTSTQLNDVGYTLFSYNFSNGLSPFMTMGTFSDWSTDWALDRSFVSAGGFGNKAWLISPQFNLSEVYNPKLEIRHILMIDKNKREKEFDRGLFLTNAFKVMVSTTYTGGDPELAKWERLEISELPSSFDFHTITSPAISLNAYQEGNVSIALVLDTTHPDMGKHYITWQVENFEILGANPEAFTYTPHSQAEPEQDPLFTQSIDSDDLEPFRVWGQGESQWHFYAHGETKYAKASSNEDVTETWLFTPRFDLSGGEDLSVQIQHTVNSLIWDQAEVLISTDYSGGDPKTANWEKIKIKPDFETPEGSWIDLKSEPFELTEYQEQSIVMAFRFTSKDNDRHTWEIEHIHFYGEGEVSITPLDQGSEASSTVSEDNKR